MSVCVTGIAGLQLYWNYENYQRTVKTFKHDINEALNTAADKEILQRHEIIIAKFKKWMADTSFITITCNTNNRDSATVFTFKDTHPYFPNKGVSFSLNEFKQKLKQITPEAKAMVINHFGNTILREDLKKGIVFFYTPRLGDSLGKIFNSNLLNKASLNGIYKSELSARGIDAAFKLNTGKADRNLFITQKVNTALRRPYIKEYVSAGFESPGVYFLRQMKWLIISSFLLIGITIFCYAYTVKTLLTQQKLAILKDDFVNNMTHELKTPVATINIAAEAIQDFNLSKTSANEYLGIIRYQAGNLTNLIDQILKNVVSEQGNTPLNLTKVNTGELINQIISEYKPQSDAANISVNFKNDDNLTALADSQLLKNAIANLLDNAIKYGGTGSVINVSQRAENGSIIIRVKDNGPGIPAEYHAKIFERFFRVPSGDIHNVKGYGLGLSYAKSIIEKHSGTLTLISNGQGAGFTISIPLIYHEAGQSPVT
ncbi:MAG TPA: HAMP domain-containing sensor histidine kinase [Mucilaginibacter sp.]